MLLVYPLGQLALGGFADSVATQITASAGAYSLTFNSAEAVFAIAGGVGSYTISGQDINAIHVMPAAAGSYTITGQSAALVGAYVLSANTFIGTSYTGLGFGSIGESALGQFTAFQSVVSYRLNFQSATPTFTIAAQAGAFTIGGQTANLFEGFIINPAAGSYAVTGRDAVFVVSMPAASGSYALTARPVELARRLAKIHAFPRVGAPGFSAKSTSSDTLKIRAFGG